MPQLVKHFLVVLVLVAEIEFSVVHAPLHDSDEYLLGLDHVRPLKLHLEWHTQLRLERRKG